MARSPAAGRLDDESAALREQVLAGVRLELTPDRMGAPDERRVLHSLADRLTCDAGVPVGRPIDVRR